MVNQPGFEANEIGTEAVAHDRVRRFQFDPGDERRLYCDLDQNRMSEDACEGRATGFHFLRGYRTGGCQSNR
jgi:hypothetical protein